MIKTSELSWHYLLPSTVQKINRTFYYSLIEGDIPRWFEEKETKEKSLHIITPFTTFDRSKRKSYVLSFTYWRRYFSTVWRKGEEENHSISPSFRNRCLIGAFVRARARGALDNQLLTAVARGTLITSRYWPSRNMFALDTLESGALRLHRLVWWSTARCSNQGRLPQLMTSCRADVHGGRRQTSRRA